MCDLFCMLPMAVAWSSPGRVTKSQGEGTVLGFPIDNALLCSRRDHSIAAGGEGGDGNV